MMFTQSNDLYAIFRPFDTEGYRQFSFNEVKQLMISRGLSTEKQQIDAFIEEYDANETGQAQYAEIELDY